MKKMEMTYGELSRRFFMSDEICGVLGINPYCLNEGLATKSDKVEISEIQAVQMGISLEEFDSRAVEYEGNKGDQNPESRKVYLEIKFQVVVNVPGDMEISDFVNELEYDFIPGGEGEIADMEMLDYKITDSK